MTVLARPSATGFRPSGGAKFHCLHASRFNPARMERCDYCGSNIHVCGCEDALTYEQIRDNPTLIAR